MRKFPFSKKAINIMIATALVVTPLASLAPIGGTAVVNAATEEVSLVNYLNQKITQEGTTIEGITYDIVNLLLTMNANEEELKDAVNTFRTTYSGAFHDIFEGELKVDDFFVVLDHLYQYVSEKYNGETAAELLTKVINAGGYNAFLINNINALVEAEKDVADFQKTLKEHTGLSLEDLLQIKSAIDAEIGLTTAQQLHLLYGLLNDDLKDVIRDADKSSVNDIDEVIERIVAVYSSLDDSYKEPFRAARQALNEKVAEAGSIEQAFDWNKLFGLIKIEVEKDGTSTPVPTPGLTPEKGQVIVDGDTSKSISEDGKTIVTVTVDANKLRQILQNHQDVQRVTIKIGKLVGEFGQVKMSTEVFDIIKEKNPNAKVEIVSEEGSLRLPVSEINKAKLAASLGVAVGTEITITISINKVQDTAGVITKNNLKSVSNVVEFKIFASAGSKTIELNRFSQYLEREIAGTTNFNAAKSSVVRLNENGTFTAVPSLFNGSKAIFKSFSNSKYTVVENEASFADVKAGYWAKATIEKLGTKYIVQGKPNGNFDPKTTTTRAEFATLLTRSLGLSSDAAYKGQFTDVKGTEWFAKDLVAAVESGIIKGHANGTFGYNDPVTREEAAVMITRALNLVKFDKSKLDTTVDVSKFQDADKVSTWAKSSVNTLVQLGVTEGRPTGFAPKAGTQRAEMAALLERFLVKVDFMN